MSDPAEVAVSWSRQLASAGMSADFEETLRVLLESADVDEKIRASWSGSFSPMWYGQAPMALPEQWQAVVAMMELRPRTPINLVDRLQRLEASVTKLSEALLSRPVVLNTSIVDLGSEKHRVLQPIPIVIEEYSGSAVAVFPETETFGSGVTQSEAIGELKRQIVLLYDDLKEADPEDLGKLPAAWWRVLRHYMVRDDDVQHRRRT